MEENELVCDRDFGDKCNELSSFIIDNLKPLFRWSLMGVLPWACVLAAAIVWIDGEKSNNFLHVSFTAVVSVALAMVLTTVLKARFVGGKEVKDIRLADIAPLIVANVGKGVLTLLAPTAVFVLIAYFTYDLMISEEENEYLFLFILFCYAILVSLMAIPLFIACNVVVYEERGYTDALNRAFRLAFNRTFSTVIFVIVLNVVGFAMPAIVAIPAVLLRDANLLLSSDISMLEQEWFVTAVGYFFTVVSIYFFICQIMVVSIGMSYEYGNSVEVMDNVSFMRKFNNFDNL